MSSGDPVAGPSSAPLMSTTTIDSGSTYQPVSPNSPSPFVQAIHDFNPAIMPTSASLTHDMYLPFRAGEVIRVLLRDPTGWWDGEISSPFVQRGSRRGWFPSNYVREMEETSGTSVSMTTGGASTSGKDLEVGMRGERKGSASSMGSHEGLLSRASAHRHSAGASMDARLSSESASGLGMLTGTGIGIAPGPMSAGIYPSSIAPHGRQISGGSTFHSRASTTASTSSNIDLSNTSIASPAPISAALQTLLHPVIQSLSLLQTSIQTRRAHIQPSTAMVISAIRTALLQMDCLSKESVTLTAHPILARERRFVLAELSKLVAGAKKAGSDEGDEQALEETAKAARSVFASVKRFLYLANECDVQVDPTAVGGATQSGSAPSGEVGNSNIGSSSIGNSSIGTDPDPSSATSAVGPSRVSSSGPPTSGPNGGPLRVRIPSTASGNSRIQETFRMKSASMADLRAARRTSAAGPPPPLPTAPHPVNRARSPTSGGTPVSATFSSSGKSSPASAHSGKHRSNSIPEDMAVTPSEPTIVLPPPGSHRPSPTIAATPSAYATTTAIHEAIALAEDSLLSVIASFIGHIHSHQIDSHPSSHAYLIELTRETIDRVRDLLTIVEAVGRHAASLQAKGVGDLKIARDGLYEVASQLVEAAEVVANAPFAEVTADDYDGNKAKLLHITTTTLRAGTECVRLVRLAIPEEGLIPGPGIGSIIMASTPVSIASSSTMSVTLPSTVRLELVGERGPHTLSTLHRKATSLTQLQKHYESDGNTPLSAGASPLYETKERDEEDGQEELVDEDATLRVPAILTSSAMVAGRRTVSDTGIQPQPLSRSRSSSLTSPAPPPRLQRRSPSRSADLDKFTSNDYDLNLRPRVNDSSSLAGGLSLSRLSVGSASSTSTPNTMQTAAESVDQLSDSLKKLDTGKEASNGGAYFDFQNDKNNVNRSIPSRPAPAPPLHLRPAAPLRSATMPIPESMIRGNSSDALVGTGRGVGSGGGDAVGSSMTQTNAFWVVSHDYDPCEVAFNSDGTLVGGTLRVLVEKMTPHDGPVDPTFWATFFFTFRLYTTPKALVDTIIARYDLPAPSGADPAVWVEKKVVPVRLRIYNFLKAWLETHWRDTDENVLGDLEVFARDTITRTLPAMGPRLLEVIKRRMSSKLEMKKSTSMDRIRGSAQAGVTHIQSSGSGAFPTPIISKTLHAILQRNHYNLVNVTEFDPLELARQMTIMEQKLFAAVAPEDLLMTGKKPVPELKALSTLSNQITGWIADGILNELDPKKRATLLKFYIKLADRCLSLNNFSSLFAVLAGLNSSTILRLKKTWDALSSKYRIMMDRLRGVIEHTRNHAAYRARLRQVSGPCLPFLGLILSDITFTNDGNPSTRPSTLSPDLQLINQDKYAKLGRIAIDFRRYQMPFDLKEVESVQAFLNHVLAERGSGSLDALYRKSLMLEPRQGSEQLSNALEKPGWLGGRI